MVNYCQIPYASQDQVFGNFIGQRLERDQQDIRRLYSRFNTQGISYAKQRIRRQEPTFPVR